MKKMIASLLVLTMAVSLAACGSSKTDETTAAATEAAEADTEAAAAGEATGEASMVFAWWGNQVRTDNTTAAIDMYMEENPGIEIEGQAYQWSDYWTVMSTQAAGESLPDIMQQDYAYIEQFDENGYLVDMTPYVESGAIDTSNINESIINSGKVGDHFVAMSAGTNAPSLIYNKTLTDSLGIEIPDEGLSMDEFNEISKQIYEETGVKTMYWYGNTDNTMIAYIRSLGYTSFYDNENNCFSWDDPSVIQPWFEWAKQAMDEGWGIDPAVAAEGYTAVETAPIVYFSSAATQAWCGVAWSNQVAAYQNANADIEIAITQYPSDDQTASTFLKPSQFFSVTTDTQYEADAVAFVNWLTNDEEVNIQCLQGERGVPVNSEIADALAAEGSDVTKMVTKFVNETCANNCTDIYPALPSKASEVREEIGDLVEQVLYGAITPEEAANELFEKGNASLASAE